MWRNHQREFCFKLGAFMSDTSTVWNPNLQYGDWVLVGTNLQTGNDVETAVLISLFTDRLASPDDQIPDGTNDPRGWVGDLGQSVLIGSRLWLLSRSKLTPQVAATVQSMAAEALQWMIDDSVVASFDISTEIVLPKQLSLRVIAYKQDGTKIAMDFTNAWFGVS
jgi:phage gp46-like protein